MNSPELRVQHECFMLLQKCGIFAHSCPNEAGGRSRVAQTQLVSAGLVSGVADMIVWWPSKDWIRMGNLPKHKMEDYPREIGYVEFKTPAGRQSETQRTFQRLCESCGIEYALVRSTMDMDALIHRHLSQC